MLIFGCSDKATPPDEPCNPGDTGDINLNDIPNQIADAIIFTNYFIYGLEAFAIDPVSQTAQTDINRDCQLLTVGDFVYLIRIIVGDALPQPPGYYPDPVDFVVGFDQISYDGVEIGAAAFVFEGECQLNVGSGAADMTLIYNYADGYTKAFLYSFDHGATASGTLIEIIGDGELVSIEAADYYGSDFIERIIAPGIAVSADPNPFYPVTTISIATPRAGSYEVIIKNMFNKQVDYLTGYTQAGVLEIEWDASGLSDGIYFCKITVEGFGAKVLTLMVDRSA
jgi:hypothetical protein